MALISSSCSNLTYASWATSRASASLRRRARRKLTSARLWSSNSRLTAPA
jgi:hypothetical protein